jgi:hypothetical protein
MGSVDATGGYRRSYHAMGAADTNPFPWERRLLLVVHTSSDADVGDRSAGCSISGKAAVSTWAPLLVRAERLVGATGPSRLRASNERRSSATAYPLVVDRAVSVARTRGRDGWIGAFRGRAELHPPRLRRADGQTPQRGTPATSLRDRRKTCGPGTSVAAVPSRRTCAPVRARPRSRRGLGPSPPRPVRRAAGRRGSGRAGPG